jgi:hypothetical protein
MLAHVKMFRDFGPDLYLESTAVAATHPGYDPAAHEQLARELPAHGQHDIGKINLAVALTHRRQQQRRADPFRQD